jgi:hypothetical protein
MNNPAPGTTAPATQSIAKNTDFRTIFAQFFTSWEEAVVMADLHTAACVATATADLRTELATLRASWNDTLNATLAAALVATPSPDTAAPEGEHLPVARYQNVKGFWDATHVQFDAGSELGYGVLFDGSNGSAHYTRGDAESYVSEGAWRKVADTAAQIAASDSDMDIGRGEMPLTIDEARECLVAFMERHFTDKTFHRYIRGQRGSVNLAGDFAWQMATALCALTPASAQPAQVSAQPVYQVWSRVFCGGWNDTTKNEYIGTSEGKRRIVHLATPTPITAPASQAVSSEAAKNCLISSEANWSDAEIIKVLHSCGVDTYPSKFGFNATQVSATSIPTLRSALEILATNAAPASSDAGVRDVALTAEIVLDFADKAQQITSVSASGPILLTPIQLGYFAGMVRDYVVSAIRALAARHAPTEPKE